MKKRQVPKKNYIILSVMVIFVVGLCFYLTTWYKTITDYYKTNSVISDVISEIETDSLSSYLLDNPNVIMYISSSSDADVKAFEKKFKKLIVDKSLTSSILYFNLDREENTEGLDLLVSNYMSKSLKKIDNLVTPNLICFENGEIVDVLYLKKHSIDKNDVVKFLERNKVIEND